MLDEEQNMYHMLLYRDGILLLVHQIQIAKESVNNHGLQNEFICLYICLMSAVNRTLCTQARIRIRGKSC